MGQERKSRIFLHRVNPSMPGMFTSSKIRSGALEHCSSACSPVAAVSAWYPFMVNRSRSSAKMSSSSSTTKMR